jgi:trigger factor
MREAIQDGRERESREAVRSTLAQAALATAQFETPSSLVDSRVARRLENIEGELTHRGATLEEYLTSLEKTREAFDADLRAEVETEVRGELVLDEIARRENLTAEPEEIENHYHQVAAAMNQPVEEIVKRLDIESARASIQQRKAVDHLVLNAIVTDESSATVSEESDVVNEASDAAQEVGTPDIAEATEETSETQAAPTTTTTSADAA